MEATSQHLRRRISASWILPLLVLLILPAAVPAQGNYTINSGMITITKYYGPRGALTIGRRPSELTIGEIKDAQGPDR